METMMNMSWEATKQVYGWVVENYDGAYKEAMNMVDAPSVKAAFRFCDTDENGSATSDEVLQCSVSIADWADTSDMTRDYLYKFGQKYWHVVDFDEDGALNYDEFRNVWAGFAAVHAQMNLNAFDKNENGVMDASEIEAWKAEGAKMMQMFGWEFTEDQLNAFKQMWIATDIDGDYGSRSMMEQINFLLKQWAYFIQN